MKKILFVIDSLEVGGAEKSILEIVSRFCSFRPVICTLFSGDNDLRLDFINRGIELIELDINQKTWLFDGTKQLKSVIHSCKPHLVHAVLLRSELVSRLALRNTRKPILVGSFVGDTYSEDRFAHLPMAAKVKLRFFQSLDRITARRVQAFISISNFLKNEFCRRLDIPRKLVHVIPRGRDKDDLIPSIPRQSSNRDIRFVSVGRLVPLKGQEDIIRAFAIVREFYPNSTLEFAGEGPLRKELEEMIDKLQLNNSVILRGTVIDISAFLDHADIFVFASHNEGQGGAVVEAMLKAKPIICTRIPVFEEYLHDGISAILFEKSNATDLADKMKSLAEDPEKATLLGEKARETACIRFDIDRIAEAHESLYEILLEERKVFQQLKKKTA